MSLPEPDPAHRVALSVVIPVYGNEASIPRLVERLTAMATGLSVPMEAVFVVDGSPDGSLLALETLLPTAEFAAQLLAHSRNFGSFAAIRTGMMAARGEVVAVMAADLQEPPELVPQFLEHLSSGAYDVAVGRRTGRADPLSTRMMSKLFWGAYRRWVHSDIPAGGVDIFACTKAVADRLLALDESHSSLVGLLFWLGFRRVEVPYERASRTEGESGWSVRRKLRYFLDSVFSFTDLPIMLLTVMGALGVIVTGTASVVVLVARLTGAIHQAGYAPIILSVFMSTFLLLLGMGIVGSYVWRTYENSKSRPGSVVMRRAFYRAGDGSGHGLGERSVPAQPTEGQ